MMSNDKGQNANALGQECTSCSKCGCACEKRSNLDCTNWLADIPGNDFDIVEVQFKNTSKNIYKNTANLHLDIGE